MRSHDLQKKQGLRLAGMALGLALISGFGFVPVPAEALEPGVSVADSASRVLTAESRLQVDGGSTVRSWTCETATFGGNIRLAPALGAFQVAALGQAVQSMDLRIPVAELDCGNGTMNDHMWNALKSRDHGEIRFQMERYTVTAEGTSGTVQMQGSLTIAGTTRPHTMVLNVTEVAGGKLRVEGSTEFPMTEFGVQPPRLMLGTLRVHDPVTVSFDLVLEAPPAAQ